MDDFALRRRHTYGTLLLHLERRQPLALLPDREAASVAQWREAHPGVEVVVRDRAEAYAEATRTNATHASTTDPEARLYKKAKGQEAKLAYLGHVLMENRHGLAVDTRVTPATGPAEREAALVMVETIFETASVSSGSCEQRRMWHKIPAGEPVRLMGARRAIQAMRSASGSGNRSKRSLAG